MKLEVPVGIYATNTERLLVVGGGTYQYVDWPIQPFKLTRESHPSEHAEHVKLIGGGEAYVGLEYMERIPLTLRPGQKMELPSLDYPLELLKEFPEKVEAMVEVLRQSGDAEPGIEPYPMFLDIETASTEEHFPKAERDQIIAIQVKFLDTEEFILINDMQKATAEATMIMQFLELCETSPTGKSPDFIVGFNLNKFDIPYLKTRIAILRRKYPEIGRKYDGLSRIPLKTSGGEIKLFYPSWIFSGKQQVEHLDFCPGLLNLDLFLHAKTDQAMAQLPSRGLKNAAKTYGCTVFDLAIEEKKNMAELLKSDRARFIEYSKSDIIATEYLYNVYKTRLIASSNLLRCPMSMVHRMTSGQKSYLVLYRECRKNGYYSLTRNEERYQTLYDRAEKYQGALVACYHRGYFPRTVYLDAKSMYPNIMHDFNVSYDRYVLDAIIDYDDWEEERKNIPQDASVQPALINYEDGDPCITAYGKATDKTIYIPDDNYRVVLKFRFDLVTDGFVRRMINHYNGVRDEFKRKAKESNKKFKETGERQYQIDYMNYNSTQAEAKIINNTFYGVQGNRYYDVADLPAAIFVTALGRWLMTEMVRLFGKKAIIEIDTDGLLLNQEFFDMDIKEINKTLRSKINDFFGVPAGKMNFLLEFEDDGSVYMYKRKNYILRKNSDSTKLYTKGSAFKGYDKAKVIQRAVRIVSDAVMFRSAEPDAYRKACIQARDVESIFQEKGIQPFKFTKTLKKNPEQYKGYRSVETIVMAVDHTGTEKDILAAMKQRAMAWLDTVFGKKRPNKRNRGDRFRELVKSCKNGEQLKHVLSMMAYAQPKQDRANSYYFMLDLIMRLQQKGRTVEADDVLEYYYTATKEQYTLADDMQSDTRIAFERYLDDIDAIIDRFSHADPRKKSLNLFDMLESDDDEDDVEEGFEGSGEEDGEED